MKNNLKTVMAIIAFIPCTALADAQGFDKKYFEVQSSRVEVSVKETDEAPPLQNTPSAATVKSVAALAAAGGMVNTGVAAWHVINSARPDSIQSSAYASAVPSLGQWATFSGWKKKEVTYTYSATNLMQIDVVKVIYKVAFFYNGTDQRSQSIRETGKDVFSPGSGEIKGRYIANFTVRPVQVNVKWGFKYSLKVTMSDPMNIGTSDDPLAYLQADLNWNVATPFSSTGGIYTYGVDGTGNFKDLTEKSEELTKQLPRPETKNVKATWN